MTGSTSGQLTPFGIEAVSKLEAIAKIGACADGRVCLLDFAAVQNKLGERWEARKQDVCEIISRIIQRAAGRAAIFALVKDCQFVLCFAESEKGNAAALSYRIMEEVLSHFLGTVDRRDVKVGYVTSLDGGQVMSRGLTSKEGLDSGATPMIPLKPKPKISPEPILIEDAGGRVPVRYGLESIVAVRLSSAIGYRLSATLFDEHSIRPLTLRERTVLPTVSLLALDLRTLLEARASGLTSGDYPCTMLPLSLQSFSYSRSRTAIFDLLNRLKVEQRSRLLIELVGIEDGTPPSALAEAAALLKPFCRTVVFQAPTGRAGLANLRSARPSAISFAAPDLGAQAAKVASGLLVLGEGNKGAAPILFATGLSSEAFLAVCAVAGFSHASFLE
jgi:hypothetical protein